MTYLPFLDPSGPVKSLHTRVIMDCIEVSCQMPSSLKLNGELFSSYKYHTKIKGFVGISPGGAITFISQLYTGSISDREIVKRSGLLDVLFKCKDSVMAGKGFTISLICWLWEFHSTCHLFCEDQIKCQQKMWYRVVPLYQIGVVNQMWAVCAFLCNAQPNIISV